MKYLLQQSRGRGSHTGGRIRFRVLFASAAPGLQKTKLSSNTGALVIVLSSPGAGEATQADSVKPKHWWSPCRVPGLRKPHRRTASIHTRSLVAQSRKEPLATLTDNQGNTEIHRASPKPKETTESTQYVFLLDPPLTELTTQSDNAVMQQTYPGLNRPNPKSRFSDNEEYKHWTLYKLYLTLNTKVHHSPHEMSLSNNGNTS